jgi:hypothetical protein
MKGEIRVPSLHLVLDLEQVSMISSFQNGRSEAARPKWMLYIQFNNAPDVFSLEIVDPAIYEEVCGAIDGIGQNEIYDTKWKTDLVNILQKELDEQRVLPIVMLVIKSCLSSHKSKAEIYKDIWSHLKNLNLTPGIVCLLEERLK